MIVNSACSCSVGGSTIAPSGRWGWCTDIVGDAMVKSRCRVRRAHRTRLDQSTGKSDMTWIYGILLAAAQWRSGSTPWTTMAESPLHSASAKDMTKSPAVRFALHRPFSTVHDAREVPCYVPLLDRHRISYIT